ncbi:MAG TPA: hypothetical protein V6C78_21910 [Crinalium sp.]|jgi:hypothetical protein
MNFNKLGYFALSGAIATLLTGFSTPSIARLSSPLAEVQPSEFPSFEIAQACQGNQRAVSNAGAVSVYATDTDPYPTAQQIIPGTVVTLTGVVSGSGDAGRVQINSPVQGWVRGAGLTCTRPTPSPTPVASPSPSPALPIVTRCVRRIPEIPTGLVLNSNPSDRNNVQTLGYAPGERFQTNLQIRLVEGRRYLSVTGPRAGWILLNSLPEDGNISYVGMCPQQS